MFWGTETGDWTTVYHTAIYVGGGRIVEATGNVVQLNTLDQWGSVRSCPSPAGPEPIGADPEPRTVARRRGRAGGTLHSALGHLEQGVGHPSGSVTMRSCPVSMSQRLPSGGRPP